MRFTPVGKVVVILLVVGLAVGVWRFWNKIAPAPPDKASVNATKIDLPTDASGSSTASSFSSSPSADAGCSDKPEVRLLGYAWNAQMGMLLANGGAQATKGSIMCRNGVNFRWGRQDDNGKLQEALVAFATDLSQGHAQPTKGAHFITIMGDGAAAFLAGANNALKRIGPEYQAKIVDAIGYSRGEDKFMGPPAWKADPSSSKGGVVAGVLRDGDWNIAQKWLGDNGLRTNPSEKTWDPDALNWVAANDYIDAAEKYIAGYSEDRDVVRNGKKTGEKKRITVQGVVTWTPGDVNVAKKKGGLISIASTKEYKYQMPCVVIGIDKWMHANHETVESMIQAIAEGGDLVQTSPEALTKAAKISADVYKEAGDGPDFWEKYYKGTQEVDKSGLTVDLGGSSVNNISQSLLAMGLAQGSSNLVAATYKVFGDVVKAQYPELVPDYPAPDSVIDTSYLKAVQNRVSPSQAVIAQSQPKYNVSETNVTSKPVVSRKSWNIKFNPNSSDFTPEAAAMMEKLSRDLLVAGGTIVEVHGHTDNQGHNPTKSYQLSKARALAVEHWLENRSPVNFPPGRVWARWHGEEQPLVQGDNPQAWAQNRRVEIVLRSAE